MTAPDAAALLAAIEHGLASDPSREFVARRLAWWRMNDAIRWDDEASPPVLSEAARQNMHWLLGHVQRNGPPRDLGLVDLGDFMEIELLRNLSRFDQALELLAAMTRLQHTSLQKASMRQSLVNYWLKLSRAHDARVRTLV